MESPGLTRSSSADVVVHAQASIGLAVSPPTAGPAARSCSPRTPPCTPRRAWATGSASTPRSVTKSAQLGLAEELHAALERHELVVEYQAHLYRRR